MKIQLLSEHIFIATKPIDFRKGLPSLCAFIVDTFIQLPQVGIFIFYNQQRNKIKLLGWHRNGFILLHKVLETGKFHLSLYKDQNILEITPQQLSWLLAGLNWELMSLNDDLVFEDYF